MADSLEKLFEEELRRRGVTFDIDADSGRHSINRADGTNLLVSLDNLRLDFERDGDPERVERFVTTVLYSGVHGVGWPEAARQLYLAIEPSDYEERNDLIRPISDAVDRVPVLYDASLGTITWVNRSMLKDWPISEETLWETASANLASALEHATLSCEDIDGIKLGFLVSDLPFKAALLLAPNLREIAGPVTGWPLLAVAPSRDFMYFWAAEHKEMIGRVGGVVVREFNESGYPLSTEVFEVDENGLTAIGAFPTDAPADAA